jgi:hypothetical protein
VRKLHFIWLFALGGCDTYGVGGGGYDYGGAPAYYDSGRGGYGPGYAPYYERERQERRWQNQDAQGQRSYNAPPPRQAPPPSPSPPSAPSAAQNRKALENLGFRPNQ